MGLFTEKEIMNFNEIEYGVYNCILNNSDKIPYMTIRELAEEAHVSTTTILRFCKKIHCNGFAEFKVRFKMERERRRELHPNNDIMAIQNFLKRASENEFMDNLNRIAQALDKAKTLIFVGAGNSAVMAQYAARYFSSVGKFALHVDNPMFEINLENPRESAVIIFSVSGETPTMMNTIPILKEGKTTIISVTNSKSSTIAKLSDYNVSYYVQHERKRKEESAIEVVDTTTQFPVVYIIETLAKKTYNLKA